MLLIKKGNLYTITNGILEGYDILVKDGKIAKIDKDIEVKDEYEVIDAENKYVTPGFVEAHSHVGLSEDGVGAVGSDHNETSDPVTPQLRAIDGLNTFDVTLREAYEAGITTAVASTGSANVIGGQSAAIKLYGTKIDDMIIKEPVGMKIAFGENPKRFYGDKGKAPSTRMGVAYLLRDCLIKSKHYLEKKENAKDSSEMPEYNMKYEAMIPVLKKEIPLKAHAHRADDILTAIRIAKEFDVDLTIDHCSEGHLIVEHLEKETYPAIVGPTFGRRTKVEVKNKNFETPKILHEAGIKMAITTDSPVIPLYGLPIAAGLAIKAGLPEEEAFRAITITPAEIIGIEDRVGSLEEGKDADIVVFDGHPLRDITNQVEYTIIDGRIIYKAKDLTK